MTDSGEAMSLEDLPPSQNLVLSLDSMSPEALSKGGLSDKPDPLTAPTHELMNKSIAELKEMGAEEMLSMDFRHNAKNNALEPKMGAEDKEKLRESM
jgi:hypothetical protein